MNNIKEEVKGFWNKNKGKIIFGAKCLAVGFGIGFVKGGVDMLAAINYKEKVNFYYKIGAMFNTIDANIDDLSSKLPECDPAAFLRHIKDDDLILNELRNRTYDHIYIDETDIGKDVVEIMKDILDNHWRADGYEC